MYMWGHYLYRSNAQAIAQTNSCLAANVTAHKCFSFNVFAISLCKQHSRHDNNILQALQQQYVHMEQMVVMVTFAQANVTSAQALTTKQLPSHREVSLTNQLLTCLDVGPQENQRFHRAPIGHAATQV